VDRTRAGEATLQLKAHALLESLQVVDRNRVRLAHRPWVGMLESHNFALLSLLEQSRNGTTTQLADTGDSVHAYLSRNRRIFRALDDLGRYGVSPAALLPHVLGMATGLPSVL
jgi:hypothetical protein